MQPADAVPWPIPHPDHLSTVRLFGGGKRDRTADLLHAMQALSQLSYTPVEFGFSTAFFRLPGCFVVQTKRRSSETESIYRFLRSHQVSSKRCTTTSRSNSASTASTQGLCARPHTSRRTGMANWGIFRPASVSVSLRAAAMAALSQVDSAFRRAASAA